VDLQALQGVAQRGLPRPDGRILISAHRRERRAARLTRAVAVLVLAAGLPAGCSLGTSRSCDEQQTLAATLAGDETFGRVSVTASSTDSYTSYPCQDNSGGSLVTAGRRYTLERPLTFDALRTLATKAADPARWQTIAQIRPEDPGSGGDAHVCYRATGGGQPQYLTFHAIEREPLLLYVEVSQAEDKVEMCPSPG
jgi:hypothetical protein